MIRRAAPDDIPKIVALGRHNYAAIHGTDAGYDPASAAQFLEAVVFAHGSVWLSDAGMIGGVIWPRWHAPGFVEAVELMWFAADGSGGRLLRRFVDWARSQNAQPVITSERQIPARLAARLGLRRAERIYRG